MSLQGENASSHYCLSAYVSAKEWGNEKQKKNSDKPPLCPGEAQERRRAGESRQGPHRCHANREEMELQTGGRGTGSPGDRALSSAAARCDLTDRLHCRTPSGAPGV